MPGRCIRKHCVLCTDIAIMLKAPLEAWLKASAHSLPVNSHNQTRLMYVEIGSCNHRS